MEVGGARAPPPFWAGGPSPGAAYSPGGIGIGAGLRPYSRTLTPMVTGTSVLGVKFEGGVVIAADMMGSYGSLARFRSISRLLRVNDSTVLGASGDYADFQYLTQIINQMVIDEELLGDGHSYSPKAIHSWLTRVMYNRRSKINPLWNTVVIGGFYNGESFLGYVDMLGVAYEAPTLATGYGAARVRAVPGAGGVLPRRASPPVDRRSSRAHHVLQVQRLHAAPRRGRGLHRLQPAGNSAAATAAALSAVAAVTFAALVRLG